MATTTTPKTGIPTFDTAFEQVKDGSEQVWAAARKAGELYLDTAEKAFDRTLTFSPFRARARRRA